MEFIKLIEIIFNKVPLGKMMYTILLTLVLYTLAPASWLDLVPRSLPFGPNSLTMLVLTFAISYALVDLAILAFGWSGKSLSDLIKSRKLKMENEKSARIFHSLNDQELTILFTFIFDDFGSKEIDKLDPTTIKLIQKGIIKSKTNSSYGTLDEKYHPHVRCYYLSLLDK